jgi:hypothetical protein
VRESALCRPQPSRRQLVCGVFGDDASSSAGGELLRDDLERRRIERCCDGVERVRKALFEFVDQVVDELAYTWPSAARAAASNDVSARGSS